MTSQRPNASIENVGAGALLALLAIPLGVIVLALLASIGFVASISGFVVAFAAVWLYRRGSGGIISRTGAWVITAIVLATLLIGIWVSIVVGYAGGLGHLGNLQVPQFWSDFNRDFPSLLKEHALSIVLILVFGGLGSFRTLGRAFSTTRVIAAPYTGVGSPDGPPASTTTVYQNDVDGAPTGSADDKTPPPSIGS